MQGDVRTLLDHAQRCGDAVNGAHKCWPGGHGSAAWRARQDFVVGFVHSRMHLTDGLVNAARSAECAPDVTRSSCLQQLSGLHGDCHALQMLLTCLCAPALECAQATWHCFAHVPCTLTRCMRHLAHISANAPARHGAGQADRSSDATSYKSAPPAPRLRNPCKLRCILLWQPCPQQPRLRRATSSSMLSWGYFKLLRAPGVFALGDTAAGNRGPRIHASLKKHNVASPPRAPDTISVVLALSAHHSLLHYCHRISHLQLQVPFASMFASSVRRPAVGVPVAGRSVAANLFKKKV